MTTAALANRVTSEPLYVDMSCYGRASTFSAPAPKAVRASMSPGDIIDIQVEASETHKARILRVNEIEGSVTLELIGAWPV